MSTNTYAGILEDWQLRLIRQRARRRGLRGQDVDEAVQQVAIALVDFQFDESKSNGASETTVFMAIVDRQLAMLRRREARQRKRVEHFAQLCDSSYEPTRNCDLVDCVRRAVDGLPAADRQVCELLVDGRSTNEIAALCGISWHTANSVIQRIRRHFESYRLQQLVEA